ncbi:MAG: MFS transporter [Candidatus Riflebacteria bacterium]|nr:MFS transporter [Candidatus Riflebacteria bacterium]
MNKTIAQIELPPPALFINEQEKQSHLESLMRFVLDDWRQSTFAVMLFGYVGYYICRGNLSAAFPLMSQEFGYSNAQLGIIASASEIAYAIGKFINGPLADKIGGRRIFLLGMLGAIVMNLIFSQMHSITAFIAVWCICRYFLSMGWGGLTKTIGAWYEPERNGTVMGVISLNFQFGGVVATLLAGGLVALGCTWDKLFIYPALLLFLIFIWSARASKDSPQDVIPGVRYGANAGHKGAIATITEEADGSIDVFKIMRGLLGMRLFRYLLLYSFITTLLRSIFFFWTPKFLVDIGMGSTYAILKSALFPFLGCVGTVLLGWYTDKFATNGDRARAMWIMLCGLVVCMVGIAILSSGTVVSASYQNWIVVLLGMSGFFLLGPYAMSSGCLTLDIAGAKGAGSCTGLIDGIGYLGGALAAWGAGYVSDKLGWSEVFMILTVFSILAVLSAWLMSMEFQRIAKENPE